MNQTQHSLSVNNRQKKKEKKYERCGHRTRVTPVVNPPAPHGGGFFAAKLSADTAVATQISFTPCSVALEITRTVVEQLMETTLILRAARPANALEHRRTPLGPENEPRAPDDGVLGHNEERVAVHRVIIAVVEDRAHVLQRPVQQHVGCLVRVRVVVVLHRLHHDGADIARHRVPRRGVGRVGNGR
jgi:hypothetical protein